MTKEMKLIRDLAWNPDAFLKKWRKDALKNGVENPTYDMLIKSLNRLYNAGCLTTTQVLTIGIYAQREMDNIPVIDRTSIDIVNL